MFAGGDSNELFEDLGSTNPLNNQLAFDMLQELEKNTPEEIRRQRTHFRLSIKARVTLLPGSASDALKLRIQGVTGDISEGGLNALFPMPVHVGDVYRLEFDREEFDLPTTFVLCRRCLLLRDDAYEAGFSFFAPISLPANVAERLGQQA